MAPDRSPATVRHNPSKRSDATESPRGIPQLQAKLERIHEAKQEPSFCGQLRQAIHSSGRLITHLAAEAGITTQQLSDFLAGDRTLRSDVLDRLTAAVGASLIVAERK